jgi:hypothetical protein
MSFIWFDLFILDYIAFTQDYGRIYLNLQKLLRFSVSGKKF